MLPLAPDRRLLRVARQHAELGRQGHQAVHHRAPDDVGRAAADRVLEQHVSAEAHLVVDDERDAVVGVARQRDRTDGQPAGDEVARDDGDPETVAELILVLHVVGVSVRPQQVRRGQPFALDELEQRLERRTAVDEDGDAARRVADDVCVREPARRASTDRRSCGYTLRKSADGLVRLHRRCAATNVAACLIALALGLLAAGCLGGTETTATPDTVVGEVPTSTTSSERPAGAELTGDATAGKAVFTSAGCGGCHTLADAGANGNVGPNLDEAKPDTSWS